MLLNLLLRVFNYSTISCNGTAFKLGDLDVFERHQLLLELIRRIILVDEILDVILFHHPPLLAIESFDLKFLLARACDPVITKVSIRCNKSGLQFLYLWMCIYIIKIFSSFNLFNMCSCEEQAAGAAVLVLHEIAHSHIGCRCTQMRCYC